MQREHWLFEDLDMTYTGQLLQDSERVLRFYIAVWYS